MRWLSCRTSPAGSGRHTDKIGNAGGAPSFCEGIRLQGKGFIVGLFRGGKKMERVICYLVALLLIRLWCLAYERRISRIYAEKLLPSCIAICRCSIKSSSNSRMLTITDSLILDSGVVACEDGVY